MRNRLNSIMRGIYPFFASSHAVLPVFVGDGGKAARPELFTAKSCSPKRHEAGLYRNGGEAGFLSLEIAWPGKRSQAIDAPKSGRTLNDSLSPTVYKSGLTAAGPIEDNAG